MVWAFVSQSHDPIRQALFPHRGQQITYDQWEAIVMQVPGLGSKAKYVHPSDHCSNMSNAAACDCAGTNQALVKRVRRGSYLVL